MKLSWERWVVLPLVCWMAGCGQADAIAQTSAMTPYQRADGWSSECFGRFVVDAPGTLELGRADTRLGATRTGRTNRYSDGTKGTPFGGGVSLVNAYLLETGVLSSEKDFRRISMHADGFYRIDLTRDGGPEEEEDARRRATQKLELPNNAFIWRHKNQFDFGMLVESDMRARMLHGQLSGEGSLAQAKAVIDTLWPRYRPRKSGEIPADAGICTPYGFFADPPKATERDYGMAFNFPDVRHSNLVLRLAITTHSERTLSPGEQLKVVKPEDMPTPWDEDKESARKEKENCRPQQGTASRDLFGCTFAGLTNITKHREVEYMTLSNGQRARLLVMEYRNTLDGSAASEVRLEAPGEPNPAERPWIEVSAQGMPKSSRFPSMSGKNPPSLDEAVSTVRTIAASLRLRPGAVVEGAPVKDTLDGVR